MGAKSCLLMRPGRGKLFRDPLFLYSGFVKMKGACIMSVSNAGTGKVEQLPPPLRESLTPNPISSLEFTILAAFLAVVLQICHTAAVRRRHALPRRGSTGKNTLEVFDPVTHDKKLVIVLVTGNYNIPPVPCGLSDTIPHICSSWSSPCGLINPQMC